MFPLRRWRLILAHLTLATTCVVMLITARSVVGGGTTGDFPLFLRAGRALVAGEPLHAPDRGYIYGPFPALVFAPLGQLGAAAAARIFGIFNAAALWFCIFFGAREAVRAFTAPRDRLIEIEVALIGLLLSLDKARSVINGGQTDFLVLLPLVLALAWNGSRPVVSGIALGFAANIKYTTLVLLPYLAWRRQWRACGSMIVSTVAFALAPALVCGWGRNLEHWRASLAGLGRLLGAEPSAQTAAPFGSVTFEHSISISSAISRWLIPIAGGHWASAAIASVALLTLAVCWALYRHNRIPLLARPPTSAAEPLLRTLEWTGLIAALLAFSPQTQGRHFVLLMPMYLAAGAMLRKPRAPRWALVAGLLILQAGLILPPPGIGRYERAVQGWRAVGGASWCLLVAFACYLRTGLRTAATVNLVAPRAAITSAGTASPDRGS